MSKKKINFEFQDKPKEWDREDALEGLRIAVENTRKKNVPLEGLHLIASAVVQLADRIDNMEKTNG